MRKILVILVILVIAVLLCGSTTVPPAQDDGGGGSVFLLKEYRTVYVTNGVSGGWGLYCVGVSPTTGKPVLLGSLATSQADTLDHLRVAYDQQARAFEKPALYYNTRTGRFK